MAEESSKAIVIDTGSGYVKAGLASDECPTCCMPNVIAWEEGNSKPLVGQDALAKVGQLRTCFPVQRGLCKDWDALEHVWQHTFLNQLRLDSTEHPLLSSYYPDENKIDRETTAMIFFETFQVPGYYSLQSALLSLYGSGRSTGLILDSGEGQTSAVPILDGYVIPHAHIMQNFGGQDLDKLMASLMSRYDISKETANRIRERRGYLALDYQKEMERYNQSITKSTSFDLPDGRTIEVGSEAMTASEAVFDPSLASSKEIGVVQMIYESLFKVGAEVRKEFAANIILSGGNTLIKNYSARFTKGLNESLPPHLKPKVFATNDRQYLSWIGGGIITTVNTFQSVWITQPEYQENGPTVIYRKCL